MTKRRILRNMGYYPQPEIAEFDSVSLVHGLCGSDGFTYNQYTIQNTLYTSLLALKMIDPATGYRLV
jgi:hypothetical protein